MIKLSKNVYSSVTNMNLAKLLFGDHVIKGVGFTIKARQNKYQNIMIMKQYTPWTKFYR